MLTWGANVVGTLGGGVLAESVGVAMPGAAVDRQVIAAAAAAIGGDHDFSTVTTQLRPGAPAQED